MAAYTSFLSLYKPGGGSTGLILPDEVVDIDRINANMDLIDAYAAGFGKAADRNHQLYGPAIARIGVTGMKLGDTYQESDGNKYTWRHDGVDWRLWEAPVVSLSAGPFGPGWASAGGANDKPSAWVSGGMGYLSGLVTATAANPSDNFVLDIPSAYAPVRAVTGALAISGLARVTTGSGMLLSYQIQTSSDSNPGRVQVGTRSASVTSGLTFGLAGYWKMAV